MARSSVTLTEDIATALFIQNSVEWDAGTQEDLAKICWRLGKIFAEARAKQDQPIVLFAEKTPQAPTPNDKDKPLYHVPTTWPTTPNPGQT